MHVRVATDRRERYTDFVDLDVYDGDYLVESWTTFQSCFASRHWVLWRYLEAEATELHPATLLEAVNIVVQRAATLSLGASLAKKEVSNV